MEISGEEDGTLLRPVNAVLVPETGYLVVNLNKRVYGFTDQSIRYQGRVFQPKRELHITIISQDAEKITRHLQNDPDEVLAIQELVTATDWRFRKLPAFYHIVEAPGVETIIQMVEIPNLESFLRELSGQVGQGFFIPPAHVTLYTRGNADGIGLPTMAVFQELVKAEVMLDQLEPVKDAPGSPGASPPQA